MAEHSDFMVVSYQDTWTVSLPHQCEDWTISYASPHDVAVADLKRFIAEATDALDRLEAWQSDSVENANV